MLLWTHCLIMHPLRYRNAQIAHLWKYVKLGACDVFSENLIAFNLTDDHWRRADFRLLRNSSAIAAPQPKEQKMKTICITYDDQSPIGGGNVVDCGNGLVTSFTWNSEYEIIDESPDTDCEDFNDNARWLMKALLEILKMEKQDPAAHCDWSADFDKHKDTGKYRFSCAITRVQP